LTGSGSARRWAAVAAVVAALSWFAPAARAQPLVADLSNHLVAITTGFVGTEVLLFGAVDGDGDGDVIVVVRGPDQQVVVRRKERTLGLWLNRDHMTFAGVPSFYSVAASRAPDEIAEPAVLDRLMIGFDHIRLDTLDDRDPAEVETYRAALIRNKQRAQQFRRDTGRVNFLGARLFRTNLFLPSNVHTGTYTVDVFLIREGEVVGAQTTPLIINKIGLGAELYDFAHDYAASYGLIAVALALVAGWAAAAVFRRF